MINQFVQGKAYSWMVLTAMFTPLTAFMENYVFNDWEFLKFLMILMIIDTITGLAKYIKLRMVSSHAFGKIFTKIILYFSVLVLTHVITHFKVHGSVNVLFGWFDDFTYSALIIREAISILENFGVICPNIIPKRILDKLNEYDINGKFKQDNK